MRPAEYWQQRAEANARIQHAKADLHIVQISKEYDRAIKTITRNIEAFYGRFAINNEISLHESKKLLDAGELKEFKLTLEEFTGLAKDNADGRWTKTLNNVYYRTRISRYEALLVEIGQQVELLTGSQQNGVAGLLMDTYKEGYYRTLFEIQRGTGFGASFAKLDEEAVKKVLYTDWVGANFSKRIWSDRDKLVREIETNLSQAFIRGDSLDKVTKTVQERMNVSKSNAARLVSTESANVAGEATMAGYKESGVVQQYQFLATLDMRTSSVCQSMDNLIFKLSEKQTGVNYPPLHPRCRSTTVAYFGDEDPSERIARGANGDSYFVPENMSYKDWYQQHVIDKYGSEQAEILKKKVANESSDKAQHERYKEVLGKDMPKSLTAFQDLKYTNTRDWESIKRQYNIFDKIEAGNYSDAYKDKLRDTYRYFKKDGHEFTMHALNRVEGQKTGKGKRAFTRKEIKGMLDEPANYKQSDGKLIRFKNGIAVFQAQDTGEIVSVVTREHPKIDWEEI